MIGSFLILSRIKWVVLSVVWPLHFLLANAQLDSTRITDPIQVIARPSTDSIVLRWAPIEEGFWRSANNYGYTIKRYTLVQNGKPLAQPIKKVITESPMRPYPEKQWISIVNTSKYAAIASQALFGETFQIDMKNGRTADIVNKSTENTQRFSIALFCADLSVATAKALGLYYVDKEVSTNEKYLYRITSRHPRTGAIVGSIYVSPDGDYQLPKPVKFSAEAKGNLINLRWDQSYHKRIYTSYFVERSDDGKNFKSISEDPFSTLTPDSRQETQYQYAYDSVEGNSKEYHYRVRGLTAFGETGPPSEVQIVKLKHAVTGLPYITSAITADNQTITLEWSFPAEQESLLDGFYVERSASPSGVFMRAHEGVLNNTSRTFADRLPKQTNYYRVTAQTSDKEFIRSMTYYAQLVDSIPPSAPVGFQGSIDDLGEVTFSWTSNAEEDIYGYRVYRSYYTTEEFTQVTTDPIQKAKYRDRVNVQSLNENIHYRVMALDRNQNHSALSEIFTLAIPDKVPPVTPTFLPVKSSDLGVKLTWTPSASKDVVQYELYRKGETNQWIRMAVIQATKDTLYTYTDSTLKNGETRHYTIVSVDDAGLESPPVPAVTGTKIKKRIWPAVEMQSPEIDRVNKKLILRWSYDNDNVKLFQIYKAMNDDSLKLFRSVSEKKFMDRISPGKYHYKVIAVLADGSRSEMGNGVSFTF
jgi:uncharacterized protein